MSQRKMNEFTISFPSSVLPSPRLLKWAKILTTLMALFVLSTLPARAAEQIVGERVKGVVSNWSAGDAPPKIAGYLTHLQEKQVYTQGKANYYLALMNSINPNVDFDSWYAAWQVNIAFQTLADEITAEYTTWVTHKLAVDNAA